jgi:hypothetical protein
MMLNNNNLEGNKKIKGSSSKPPEASSTKNEVCGRR